jgi:hypothetical protein
MLVTKQYNGPASTSLVVHGLAIIAGDGALLEIWPSESPEHSDDFVTLTLTVDDVVVMEMGRFASYDAAKVAAQEYFDEHGVH